MRLKLNTTCSFIMERTPLTQTYLQYTSTLQHFSNLNGHHQAKYFVKHIKSYKIAFNQTQISMFTIYFIQRLL